MNSRSRFDPQAYQWTPQPAAAEFLHDVIKRIVQASPWLAQFGRRLVDETGTRLFDWIDHLVVDADVSQLTELGFSLDQEHGAWRHQAGLFPSIVAAEKKGSPAIIGIKVESVAFFLETQGLVERSQVVGEADSPFRMASTELPDGQTMRAVERHGYRGFSPGQIESLRPRPVERYLQTFRGRDRSGTSESSFKESILAAFRAVSDVGRDWACDLFFATEREYWQSRNHAARVQYARQNSLGLGWANHDHHTYRCSREYFAPLIWCLETMGFECRERFYAGSEAGWGAQVLEQPQCGIVVFADVDLSEDEVANDFAHEGLPPRDQLGTVGLWCKLHGDSFTAAGMHHLECQFDFDAARSQLLTHGIRTMAPFTDFPHLKQAFTEGEIWRVDQSRLDRLVKTGSITAEQAAKFADSGAIGSHLEILERNDGYKGFNQTGISKIIRETDPRG